MPVAGGLRARLIRDSTYRMLQTALYDLGWLSAATGRKDVTISPEPLDYGERITPNRVAFTSDINRPMGGELGSNMSEFRWLHFVEVLAENESIGTHLGHDIRDLLEGRLPSVSRPAPVVPVYDLRVPLEPPVLFTVDIEDVVLDRPTLTTQSWQRYLWSVRFTTVDSYTSELVG